MILAHQRGAALLLIVMVLFVGAAAFLFSAYPGRRQAAGREAATTKTLTQGKDLAISFAVTNQTAPGGLPFPDRRQDNNYDGNGDCLTAGFDPTQHLLGQWPSLLEQECGPNIPAFGRPLQDGAGANLWYAVSRNLVKSDGGNYPVINSELLDLTTCWFTVVNEQGTVLTQRAAVVLLAPGLALAGQNRGGAAPTANNFLEAATIGGVTYTNYAIEATDTGFILQPPNDTFNDRLVYITIDELMTAVTWRVAGETKKVLDDYWAGPNEYPVDQTAFESLMTTDPNVPSWYSANGWNHPTYLRDPLDTSKATLEFVDCVAVYTLEQSGVVSRDTNC